MTQTKSTSIWKRLLVLLLVAAMIANIALPVFAADEYPTPYPDLKVTHTKSGYEWGALNEEKTEWGITVYGRSATGGYQPSVRFTNVGNEEKVLSFDLTAEFGEGATNAYVQVATGTSGGTNLVYETTSFADRHVEIALAPNEAIRVVSKSSNGTDIPLTVTLTNLKFVKDSSASVIFLPAENGSYTVDGEAITVETALSKEASEGYALAATPADGYQFYGWYEQNTDRILSTAASTSLSFDTDSTVTALFVPAVPAGQELYGVEMENGYVPFVKFADAAGFAATMGRPQVTLLKDYTLTESITIPNGVTLLVPFDDARTLYTDVPEIDTKTTLGVTTPAAHVTPSAYRTLTFTARADEPVPPTVLPRQKGQMFGTLTRFIPDETEGTFLFLCPDGITFAAAAAGSWLLPSRCGWLLSPAAASALRIGGDAITAVTPVRESAQHPVIYTIDGLRCPGDESAQRGLYIVNGKKKYLR